MNDAMELLVGLMVCVLPLAVVGGIIALVVRALGQGRDGGRLDALEMDVAQLRGENRTLLHRLSQLEAKLADSAQPVRSPSAQQAEPTPALAEEEAVAPTPIEEPAEEPAEEQAEEQAQTEASPAAAPIVLGVENPPAHIVAARSAGEAASLTPPAPQPAPATEPGPRADAPAAATQPAPQPVPAPAPPAKIDWEQWIGVRGAAAFGASILVLAGVFFFEYSIEHGWITPAMRVIAGTLVGLGCLVAAELRLRKTHTVLANWLGGAGIAILYVAFWAGNALYHLYPVWAASIMLIAVTGACVTLAVKRDAPAIAALGLLGGFATPLALSTGSDRPYALFSYLLLLDGAMLWVAYKRRWAWMAILCLIATAFYQQGWLLARLDEPRVILGVALVAVFAALFAALPTQKEGESEQGERLLWKLARSAGVLIPLLFTIPLAVRGDLGDTYWATAVQLVLLTAAACWVGRRHGSFFLPAGAALLSLGTLLGWGVAHVPETPLEVWKLAGLALAVGAVFHVNAELRRDAAPGWVPAATFHIGGLVVLALSAAWVDDAGPWPWLAVWGALSVFVARLAHRGERAKLQLASAVLGAVGLGSALAAQAGRDGQPDAALYLGLLAGAALLMQLGGLFRRAPEARAMGDHAAAAFALLGLAFVPALAWREVAGQHLFLYLATGALALLALLVAARRASGLWMIATLVVTALAHQSWLASQTGPVDLVGMGVFAALFALAPVFAPRALREQAWAWRTAALAGPLYLIGLRHAWLEVLGPSAIGLLALGLAALSIGAATAVRARGPEAKGARRVAMVWLTASAAGFVTLAIPLQLSNEWITVGWALEALALTALWRRFDHTGLKYLALGLGSAVMVRLLMNPYVLDYHPKSALPVLGWLTYTYLVPAVCLLGVWFLLRTEEVSRRRSWERSILGEKLPLLANYAATGALLLVFAWINLTIFEYFAPGSELVIPFDRLPARDLTLSIAWALYALVLLALGMWRQSTALRVTSLALILGTSGKVFLYDLAHLGDLYRVASLAGLAISLIVISLAYQRFVFRRQTPEEAR